MMENGTVTLQMGDIMDRLKTRRINTWKYEDKPWRSQAAPKLHKIRLYTSTKLNSFHDEVIYIYRLFFNNRSFFLFNNKKTK